MAASKPATQKPTPKKPAAKKPTPKKPAAKKPAAKKSVPTDGVHYYRLVFQVEPGASRKAEFFVAGTLDEIKRATLADLDCGDGAYYAIFYGETIVLQCWEGTRKVRSIDLHPYLTFHVEGIEQPITFKKPGAEPAPGMTDKRYEEIAMMLMMERLDVKVTVDWAQVKLPKLGGRPLAKNEWAPFDDPDHPWRYGFTEDWDQTLDDP